MAKRINSASLKGLLHDGNDDANMILEEFGKKEDDPSEFFNLTSLLKEFKGKMISITIKEEAPLVTVDDDTDDETDYDDDQE